MKKSAEKTNISPDMFTQETLFDVQPRTEYKILKGHYLEDGTYKTDEELHQQYLRNTDRLIGVIDGTMNGNPPYDAVIYLDKSARPVAWMVNELWPDLARVPGTKFADGVVPERPKTYFLNIDREQWLPTIDPGHTGSYNIDAIPEETIDSLRAIYRKNENSDTSLLSNRRVLIVDEVGVTGSTLSIAQAILQRAFPDATFDTEHWMRPSLHTSADGAKRNNDIPVWYKADDVMGRAVANRDLMRSKNSKSRTQRLGMWFLSSIFGYVDQEGLQLRSEIKQLCEDLREKKILFTPSPQREMEDADERIQVINDMTLDEFRAKKQQT